MKFSIKTLNYQDVESYRAIRLESLKKHPDKYGSKFEQENSKPILFFEREIKISNSPNIMIGAFIESHLIGICGLIPNELNQFQIVQMYVKNEFIGFGVAKELISFSKKLLITHHKSELILTVHSGNIKAYELYKKCNFEIVSSNENEIKMCFLPQQRT
jgi:ribosomal protein S18 acetylase RimI-like enzyme